ncbi:hypothetical protein B6N60_03243 [Richelia sinica FACHB-800]|uniref:Uncharacterized protein n=1 Tax=Richelia sinica FACHB-800 TaxID=1357546 RepID=A0A975Y5S7_9NOST|nr:PqqD family peptide modification chaperone [Richelia sinica]MBD2663365.1 PqqD family peptide modification chaperone [Richelia sinica FACHB-800]QXE24538.1 hypothetical protein B6N60_03243 [Richelia sinica FACHB-800]
MIPVARTENLLLQDVGNELIIYDQKNNSSHCLTPIAVRVWELSNGQNTVNEIANKLEKEFDLSTNSDVDVRGLVWLTLEELECYSLIKEYLKQPATEEIFGISRRQVIKTATLVGGFAIGSMFPLVKSIIAPEPAMARSCPSYLFKVTSTCIDGQGDDAIVRSRDFCCKKKKAEPICKNEIVVIQDKPTKILVPSVKNCI